MTVTDQLPPGLSALVNNPGLGAGPVAASGTGWSCSGSGTSTCTRTDALAPGASYPPIRITVSVGSGAAATVTNAPAVVGGGDTTSASAQDAIPVAADACPNGWSNEAHVTFSPPLPAIDSGVVNPENADGCTLLDKVWETEPFASHAAFVAHVDDAMAAFDLTAAQRAAIHNAADHSGVAGAGDAQVDNSCSKRIAMTFDDGPSTYRTLNLANLRARSVHATFFDVGVRMKANPDFDRFELAEGHTVYSHTYDHPHLNSLSPALQIAEIQKNEQVFAAHGFSFTAKVLRPPFFEANTATTANISTLGYTVTTARIETEDYDPAQSADTSRDAILNQLRPGAIILLHDGPIDTPAGLNSANAAAMIIDRARELGCCFGVMDRTGQVVADRYVGGTGTITITVSNPTDTATDGSTTTVSDAIPSGLTVTSIGGDGWTCTGTGTRRCTRNDILPGHATYPPITVNVSVSATSGFRLNNAPGVTGHGGNVWVDNTSDPISVGVTAGGDVGGTVPATLSLTLGAPASFGAFTPGVAKDYTASTTANVISTAGDATLSVSDPGHLTNGAFSLPSALQVAITPSSWSGPISNGTSTIAFTQHIGATDALRTGSYSKTLTFTLSTTTP